jgi:hypothetical protein
MTLTSLLLPLAVFIGFLGLAIGGRIAQGAVIAAVVLATLDLLYRLLQ